MLAEERKKPKKKTKSSNQKLNNEVKRKTFLTFYSSGKMSPTFSFEQNKKNLFLAPFFFCLNATFVRPKPDSHLFPKMV